MFDNGNSNVYCCLLDASKAFDKINYGKLFSTLLQRNINVHCTYSKKIPQIYHKNTAKCDIVPQKCDIVPQNRVFYYKM